MIRVNKTKGAVQPFQSFMLANISHVAKKTKKKQLCILIKWFYKEEEDR